MIPCCKVRTEVLSSRFHLSFQPLICSLSTLWLFENIFVTWLFFPRSSKSNLTSPYGYSLVSFFRKHTNFCLDLLFTSRRRPALRWENGCWTSLRFTQISTSPGLNYCNPDQFDLDLTSLPLPLVQPALERGALHKHKWDGTAVITQIKSNQIANKFMASKLRCLLNWQ